MAQTSERSSDCFSTQSATTVTSMRSISASPSDTSLSAKAALVLTQSAVSEARLHLIDQLARTGQGEQDAFRTLYVLTSAKLFGICLRICGDRAAAEDVLHDVYMIVWKRAGTYEPCLGSPISWLATIARNRAIDWRRSQTRQAAVPLDDAPDLPDPTVDAEAGMLLDEASRGVFACLAALESHQGNAIRNAFFHGFTYAELAEHNCVPIGTMKSWIRRGLRQMRHNLEVAGH